MSAEISKIKTARPYNKSRGDDNKNEETIKEKTIKDNKKFKKRNKEKD